MCFPEQSESHHRSRNRQEALMLREERQRSLVAAGVRLSPNMGECFDASFRLGWKAARRLNKLLWGNNHQQHQAITSIKVYS